MSKVEWSPYFHIKEERPWPDAVHVMRGDERKLYLKERTCHMIGCGYDQSDEIKVWWYALSCGHRIYLMDDDGGEYQYGNFCTVCGARVIRKEDA